MFKIGFLHSEGAVTPTEVTIGNQIWTARNLSVTSYRNSDPITFAANATQWLAANALGEGCYRYLNDDPSTVNTYGLMYNSYAMQDPRNIAPDGYHVPTIHEYKELNNFLVSDLKTFGMLKDNVLGVWTAPNTGAANAFSYAAVPAGAVNYNAPATFYNTGTYGYYWVYNLDTLNPTYTYFTYNNDTFDSDTIPTSAGIGITTRVIKNSSVIYGQLLGGGVVVDDPPSNPVTIAYVDSITKAPITIDYEWGCLGTLIGAGGGGLGDGFFNTLTMISSACGITPATVGDPTVFYPNYGYNDWWIPSESEFAAFFVNPDSSEKINLDTSLTYWTSTEVDANNVVVYYWNGAAWMSTTNTKDKLNSFVLLRSQAL